MKISKLFHWLYAILMLLPFAFFVPSVLYYAFNDNATMQTVEVPKTETIAVDFNQLNDGFILTDPSIHYATINNPYSFTLNDTFNDRIIPVYSSYIDFKVNHIYYLKTNWLYSIHNSNWSIHFTTQVARISSTVDGSFRLMVDTDGVPSYPVNLNDTYYLQVFDLTQMFGFGKEPTIQEFNQMFPLDYYSYTLNQPMQITYDTGETEQLVSNTDIINYAWESIWDLPLFSWSKITFVSVPFAYMTGIFGIASSSSLNYVFGYFATISIVWLLFDVIMYVPMLVHRWIDKARIE